VGPADPLPGAEAITASPRMIAFLDVPPGTRFLPQGNEFCVLPPMFPDLLAQREPWGGIAESGPDKALPVHNVLSSQSRRPGYPAGVLRSHTCHFLPKMAVLEDREEAASVRLRFDQQRRVF
jgi:hypothetical protein